MKTIAILGATGHIAKGLISNLDGKYELQLFARSGHKPLGLFPFLPYDVIINCVGVREKLWTNPFEIFRITETFDDFCINYVRKHPETLYINFSSGAVFGQGFASPVDALTRADIDVNRMDGAAAPMFYGIAKLNAEAKHRALEHLNIVDLRVFGYFSRHQHPDCRTLMNEVLDCIRNDREMPTSAQDFYRDYVHPKDLAGLVERVIEVHGLNAAFDVYSRRPAGKFEVLTFSGGSTGCGIAWTRISRRPRPRVPAHYPG